jgi:hypothetical protein
LLYYFRQENGLPKESFTSLERVFRFSRGARPTMRDKSIKTFVYIDDFCGSGSQAFDYLGGVVDDIREQLPNTRIIYLMMFATSRGLQRVRDSGMFDDCCAAVELDDHYRAFSKESLYFDGCSEIGIDANISQSMIAGYGRKLARPPFGFGCCQLLIGFFHNTPDNTLPVFWAEDADIPWHPIFPRYHKIYDW